LLSSGEVLMARLRNTTDRDGDHAYQLIRPRLVRRSSSQESDWSLHAYLSGLTTQSNVVLFKSAVASVLDPDPMLRPIPRPPIRSVHSRKPRLND
jgi:hypothetical protein